MLEIIIQKQGARYAVVLGNEVQYAASPASALRAVLSLAARGIHDLSCSEWDCAMDEIIEHREVSHKLAEKAKSLH